MTASCSVAAHPTLRLPAVAMADPDCRLFLPCLLTRSGANLMGYLKCSKAAQNQIKGKFNSLFASGLRSYMFGRS